MNCKNYKYKGLGEYKNIKQMSPVKAIEITFITNKEVEINAIHTDELRRPITNGDISLVIDGDEYPFWRTDEGTYMTTKELF